MTKLPIDPRIYESDYVRALFDEMSKTYGIVNTLSSFGFCIMWRQQCAALLKFDDNCHEIVDLMSGMAELSTHIIRIANRPVRVQAVDLSTAMCSRARATVKRKGLTQCKVVEGDALHLDLESESVDCVASTFGLKTFSQPQLKSLISEVYRILKPGGQVAFLEISVPRYRILRIPYMFYLNCLVPVIGRLLLGNPDNYRLLGVYTTHFQNCDEAIKCFVEAGFEIQRKSFFFGCATGFRGTKNQHGASPECHINQTK